MDHSIIPFDEITVGATVRVCVVDSVQYLSIRDVIMHLCNLTPKRANEKWERVSSEVKKELAALCGQYKFPGPGNSTPSPVITFRGVLKLVMYLSGDKAAMHRSAMVSILTRYYAGDGSLAEEIKDNAASNAPIVQLARATLVADARNNANGGDHHSMSTSHKRKIEELEIEKIQLDIQARKLENMVAITSGYRRLCKDFVMDDRACLVFKDYYLNTILFQGGGSSSSSSSSSLSTAQAATSGKPISLSLVAGELGFKVASNELISIGIELKKRYLEKHGKPPSKHDQVCDGRVTKVNSYMESDRYMIEEVLRWHVANKQ